MESKDNRAGAKISSEIAARDQPEGHVKKQREQACKPGSVKDDHPSRTAVTCRLKRHYPRGRRATSFPSYLALLRVGFTWPISRLIAGGLLHHLFTLTSLICRGARRYVSVALSLGSPPPEVIRHPALWSRDFPRGHISPRDRPACSHHHDSTGSKKLPPREPGLARSPQ